MKAHYSLLGGLNKRELTEGIEILNHRVLGELFGGVVFWGGGETNICENGRFTLGEGEVSN